MLRIVLLLTAATGLSSQTAGLAHVALPAELGGILNGTEYKIRVPANWNGTLVVYAHGAATTRVEVAPSTFPTASPTLEEQLLSRGYALAGSLYASLEDGPQRTLALTNFFRGKVGSPQRVIVWGVSMGGDTSLALIETHHGVYDGAIAVSPEAAGWPAYADSLLRYGVAYAAAFGWPSDWWGPIEDLRDDLSGNEATLIVPVFQWANPENYGRWEFIRLVMKLPPATWWDVDPLLGLPGWALDGWAATSVRSALERDYGGPVAQNVGVVYELTSEEKAYLSTLGVDADALLASMNARTDIAARRSARNHLRQYSGDLRRPVVMMNEIFDPLVIVSNQAVYRDLVQASGKADMLVQAYVDGPGHGSFTAEQYLAALAAMEHWLDTGMRPDSSFFPGTSGFDTDFVPPSWPY
jgi:pimeloyl-ACP methyl ester carboxylesterase